MIEHLTDDELSALADATLLSLRNESDVGPLRAHAASCEACRERFERLMRMLKAAESMPKRVEPPADLWPAIRGSIVARQAGARTSSSDVEHRSRRRWFASSRTRTALAAAAAVILIVLVGTNVGHRFTSSSEDRAPSGPASATTTASPSAIVSASAGVPDAEDLRVEEELTAALALRRSALRPSTSAKIDSSLRVIDAAIAELEAARARDPGNAAIRQLLAASRARKVELLKQAQNAS